MNTINGQWFINLDEYFDTAEVNNLFDGICIGLAKSTKYFQPIVTRDRRSQYDKSYDEVTVFIKEKLMNDKSEVKRLFANGLNKQQIYTYVKYRYPTISFANSLLLRSPNNNIQNFDEKGIDYRNFDNPAYDNFPELRQWVKKCTAFKSVGRVVLFINELGGKTHIHTDFADGISRKDQFIWINFNKSKKFFILDNDYQKHYLDGLINTFDNASWHGSEPAEHAIFSLRIDGKFSDVFLNKSGLTEYFRVSND